MQIVVLTGLSGAGKTEALHALEDVGFYCVDNLPIPLAKAFVDLLAQSGEAFRAALVIDARAGEFLTGFEQVFEDIRAAGHTLEVVFLTADDDILIRRFSATRRRHPLDAQDLRSGIGREREMLAKLRGNAKQVVDTSRLTPHDLRRHLRQEYANVSSKLSLTLLSFGFKFGVPTQADLLFDVRFIPNPFFVAELRNLSGRDNRVASFVLGQEETGEFLERVVGLLAMLLPLYQREGKSYLTCAIGCTGGMHRSVALVEELRRRLAEATPVAIAVRHRDVEKN